MAPRAARTIIHEPGLGRALRNQLGVIGALMLRELHTRFGRKNLGFVWLFIEPAILGVGVTAIRVAMHATLPGGMDPVAFFTIGYTVFYLQRSIITRAAHTVEANRSILAHARISIEDILIARSLLEIGAVMMTALVFLAFIGVFLGKWPHNILQMGIGFLLFGMLVHGISLLVLALSRFDPALIDRIMHPIMYFSIVVTGAFFMVWWLPRPYQDVVLALPFVHLYEFIREGQFGPGVPFNYDLPYVVFWIMVFNVYGGFALRRAKPFLEE